MNYRHPYGTNIEIRVPESKLIGDIPTIAGKHLWIVTAAWLIDPAQYFTSGEDVHLDTENLLKLSGVGCYVCEQEWSWPVASKPCPGNPDDTARALARSR